MELKTDHNFHIGEQHLKQGKPCQDYSLSGQLSDGTAYAIVSDGCSSGGMTDIGSRLVSLAALRTLEERVPNQDFAATNSSISRDAYLESYRASLQLQPRDLLATCLWAVVHEGQVMLHVTGDGVIAMQFEEGLVVKTFAWAQNTPYYPAYRVGGMDDSFINTHAAENTPLQVTEELVLADVGALPQATIVEKNVRQGMEGLLFAQSVQNATLGTLRSISLFSDGVEQVDQVEKLVAVQALTAFKSIRGQFVVRRMNRFIQEAKKSGRGPIDDIAQAVIHIHSE